MSATIESAPESIPTTTESTVVPTAPLAFAWPPVFAVAGTELPISVVAYGTQPDAVSIETSALPAPTTAAFDAVLGRWSASVVIPETVGESSITVIATARTGDVASPPVEITVPVASATGVIRPDVVEVEPEVALSLEFGNGPEQVGIFYPESEGEAGVANSIGLDPATGNLVILDSVNRRLLVIDSTGAVIERIPLEGDAWLDDLVVLGDSGRAVVSGFRGAGGNLEVTAHLIDLKDGTATVDGPFVIPPPAPPVGTELVWSEALDAVFGVLFDPATERVGYYRFVDTASERLDVSTVPEFWWNGRVGDDGLSAGLEFNGTRLLTRLPYGSAGLGNVIVQPGGTIWWSAGTVDWDAAPGEQVHSFIGRTDVVCASSVIAEIDVSGLSELATRSMVADDSGVFVVDIAAEYRLLRYELPPPACE